MDVNTKILNLFVQISEYDITFFYQFNEPLLCSKMFPLLSKEKQTLMVKKYAKYNFTRIEVENIIIENGLSYICEIWKILDEKNKKHLIKLIKKYPFTGK